MIHIEKRVHKTIVVLKSKNHLKTSLCFASARRIAKEFYVQCLAITLDFDGGIIELSKQSSSFAFVV